MAKELTRPQPTSSVSRLLEPGVGRAVLHDASRPVTELPSVPRARGETPDTKREFILTPSADETLKDVVRAISKATGANLTNSHFLRAVLKVIAHAMPDLEREAGRIGRLPRPSNARGKEPDREEYEAKLASALLAALRACPPMD